MLLAMPRPTTCPDCLEAVTPSADGICPFCGGQALTRPSSEAELEGGLPRRRSSWRGVALFTIAALLLALLALRNCTGP